MGTSFKINFSRCEQSCEQLPAVEDKLKSSSSQLTAIIQNLNQAMSYRFIQQHLKQVQDKLNHSAQFSCSMHTALAAAIETCKATEQRLLTNFQDLPQSGPAQSQSMSGKYLDDGSFLDWIRSFFGWGEPFTEDEIDSIVFDDDGSYGADQGSPKDVWGPWSNKKELYDTVKEYYPDMSDKEIQNYLKKLNNEGCGYVAVINTIFAAYEGREEEFKQAFGFDMYEKGDLNYNRLLVDFYAATDNHNLVDGADVINPHEDENATTGRGMTMNDQKYRAQLYLNDHGIPVEIQTNAHVTIENFDTISKDHYVSISFFNGNLQNEDGSVAQYIDGGHSMVITGTTSDGRFIVSSWGEKYYIDPNENVNGQTTFSFVTYEYQ